MKTHSIIWLLALSLLFSCKKEDVEPDDKPSNTDVLISEETRVLDSGIRAGIQSLDTISYTIHFDEGNAFAGDLSSGNVLVDDVSSLAPYGFLRKVTSVKNEDGAIVVSTSQASLEDVIQHFPYKRIVVNHKNFLFFVRHNFLSLFKITAGFIS